MAREGKAYQQMLDSNRVKNHEKVVTAITEIRKMITDDVDVTVANLMKRTGLSRSFFYSNEAVHEEIKKARRLQQGKDFNEPKRQVLDKALVCRIKILEEQLSERINECNQLREENEKMREIIAAGNFGAFLKL